LDESWKFCRLQATVPIAWSTEYSDHKNIKYSFPISFLDKTLDEPELKWKTVIDDQFSVHKTGSSEELLKDGNIEQIMIPVVKTGEMQSLDVGVNPPFKMYRLEEYHRW
jgi:hypothetical protein